jgi:hypothetical protein
MSLTEITLAGGQRLHVDGDPRAVEATILAAARGSIMELAWMTEADSRRSVGVNPEYVVTVRALEPASGAANDRHGLERDESGRAGS